MTIKDGDILVWIGSWYRGSEDTFPTNTICRAEVSNNRMIIHHNGNQIGSYWDLAYRQGDVFRYATTEEENAFRSGILHIDDINHKPVYPIYL